MYLKVFWPPNSANKNSLNALIKEKFLVEQPLFEFYEKAVNVLNYYNSHFCLKIK